MACKGLVQFMFFAFYRRFTGRPQENVGCERAGPLCVHTTGTEVNEREGSGRWTHHSY